MVRRNTRTVGAVAEQRARNFLQKKRLRLIEANYNCRFGEIDLVMFDGSCLVFVEVRYRGPSPRCTAAASVDLRKRGKLVRSAAHFLASRPRFADMCTRFDVVAIDERAGQGQAIEWIRDAFRPGDS